MRIATITDGPHNSLLNVLLFYFKDILIALYSVGQIPLFNTTILAPVPQSTIRCLLLRLVEGHRNPGAGSGI